MSALAVGAIAFACVFGGALFGMFLGTVLPKDHLSPDARRHQGGDGPDRYAGGAGAWFAACLG
jgi:hypothetical protein